MVSSVTSWTLFLVVWDSKGHMGLLLQVGEIAESNTCLKRRVLLEILLRVCITPNGTVVDAPVTGATSLATVQRSLTPY